MKKLINDPRHVVREMLEGQADLNPGIALLENEDVVVRTPLPAPAERPVAVLSGGGSGHEPAHAGYVGPGMLTAAICGDVFTSPSVDAVLAGIKAAAGPAGALLIVKNYTGDRLNFGLAAELARAEGIPVEVVTVADDVALRDTVEPARRRGIAGTVLVHKIAGAAAAAGKPLADVARIAAEVAAEVGSMGVALDACTVPAAGKPGFTLGADEVELGLGIHGEQGVARVGLQPADALVDAILEKLVADRGLKSGDRIAVLVNGLGATPPMELAIVARHTLAGLRALGIVVERAYSGNFMTALDMPGCSISVLPVDDGRLALLDAPTEVSAWPRSGRVSAARTVIPAPAAPAAAPAARPANPAIKAAAHAVADALAGAEAHLTELDSKAGDGDLGISLARGAQAIRALPDSAWADAPTALATLGDTLRRAIAGSSGPFYATALMRAARNLPPQPTAQDWASALRIAADAISELGGAKPGDRTMLDALHPAADAFAAASHTSPLHAAWASAVQAAEAGAEATAAMHPRLGRASYLGERAIGSVDAGAAAVVVWMRALHLPK